MDVNVTFPSQRIPSKQKGPKWGKMVVDWAATRTYFNYSPVRTDVVRMKTNYDLVNGIIHMEDIAAILNPDNAVTGFLPDKVQHYPIMNSKLNTLRGEEAARVFDWHVIITNPEAISKMEEDKASEYDRMIQSIVEDPNIDQAQAEKELQEGVEEMKFNWQDRREIRGNELMKHYAIEQNFKQTLNDGFMDVCAVSEELYKCDIEGGEPVLWKMNPMKLRAYKRGYSSKVEDADIIIYEDFMAPGRIVDIYYDDLTPAQIKWLSDDVNGLEGQGPVGTLGNEDDRYGYIPTTRFVGEDGIMLNKNSGYEQLFDQLSGYEGGIGSNLLPYDIAGNIRVLRVWWKSKRKLLKVKSYDPVTGQEILDFYPETYIADTDAGEEVTPVWVNEAWEGTKIGEDIYVRIRPCLVQRNSISNPSRCDFGIIGTTYSLNEMRPYSLVDMMKPYNYLYDAVHAKLVDLIATNWGKLVELDLALVPKDWKVEQWMYFAKRNKVLVKDSFREGDKGAALNKLAGGLNNASKGVVDADWGQSIQNYIELLQWAKDSMSDLVGINRQREGNTYNRETVGGIERAVLQSSYITDWLFQKHDDTKRRVLNCFLDYAKVAIKGRSKKFQYILSDGSRRIMEIDGDEFNECDYGIVVDNSNDTQKLYQQIDTLAQAALQNQLLDFASIVKLYSSSSLSEKTRMIEEAQKRMQQRQEEAQQMQMQAEQQKAQIEQQAKMQELQVKDQLNQRDNETKIRVAEINSRAEYLRLGIYAEENDEQLVHEKLDIEREKLKEEIRQFNEELKASVAERKDKKEIEMKKMETQKQIAKMKPKSSSK